MQEMMMINLMASLAMLCIAAAATPKAFPTTIPVLNSETFPPQVKSAYETVIGTLNSTNTGILPSVITNVNNSSYPEQLHLAYSGVDSFGNANSMAVNWQTNFTTATSTVKYGTASGVYTETSTGNETVYYKNYQHSVKLGVLQPATKYYYIAGDSIDGFTLEYSFVTAPLTSTAAAAYPVNFAVFGDLGE